MLRRFLLVVLFVGVGCAGGNSDQIDPCKRALERLVDECDYMLGDVDQLNTSCSGQSACIAACLEDLPCDSVRTKNAEYNDCVNACL